MPSDAGNRPPAADARSQPRNAGATSIQFDLLAQIAVGSTARVDLCRSRGPRQAGQLIAVKRPLPEFAHDEGTSRRFLDEVWMTAALRHPNVIGVVGWGEDARGAYLAVELVQGVSLLRLMKSVFETGEQFPERLVVYIGLCVARGLGVAHDLVSERGEHLNLVHRDLTAANVLVSFAGDVKIGDFGLAKAKNRLTVTTSELPTRGMTHVSPEELAGHAIDGRSDIFALGVMLYELLTGAPPFTGKDDLAVLEAIMRKPAPDPLAARPKMDRTLAALVLGCLQKNPGERPQSAHEIAHRLDEWLFTHGYTKDAPESLARFVRRNSMRQMRWFERVIAGEPEPQPAPMAVPKQTDAMERPKPATPRDSEETVVDGKPQRGQQTPAPAPAAPSRRTRSTTDLPRARRREPHASDDLPSLHDEESDDESENIPTVAMRIDASKRQELREMARVAAERKAAQQAAAAPPQPQPQLQPQATSASQSNPPPLPARAPLETIRMDDEAAARTLGKFEDPETTQDPTPLHGGALAPRLDQLLQAAPQQHLTQARPVGPVQLPPRRPDAGPPNPVAGPPALVIPKSPPIPGPRHAVKPAALPLPPPATSNPKPAPPRAAPPQPPPAKPPFVQHVELELERMRRLALDRQDAARSAREAAHRAALEADRAEQSARMAERAIGMMRQALDLATRGDSVGATRKLEEAVEHTRQDPQKPT
ncbi:MAG: serine/threonine-protein kinase [Polyangiaceae bacterium]